MPVSTSAPMAARGVKSCYVPCSPHSPRPINDPPRTCSILRSVDRLAGLVGRRGGLDCGTLKGMTDGN